MYKLILTLIVLLIPINASALIIVAFPTSIPDKCYVAIYDDFYNPIASGLIDCGGINPNNDFLQIHDINQNYRLLPEWKKQFPKSKFEKATFRNATKAEIEKEKLAVENMYQEISSGSGDIESGSYNLEIELADLLIKSDDLGDIEFENNNPTGLATGKRATTNAHELAHTVQQSSGKNTKTSNPDSLQTKANINTSRANNKGTIGDLDLGETDSLRAKANINTSRSNTKGVMGGDVNLGESDSLNVKANHNTTRSNKTGIKDIDTSTKDSLTQRPGTISNPYFKSNELAGDMVKISSQNGNNSTDGVGTHFFLSKIKEVKNGSDMRGRDYVLYKDGKQYYYDATNNELKVIFEALKKTSTNEKAAGCPPPGLSDCTPKNGFCWCYLRASRTNQRN